MNKRLLTIPALLAFFFAPTFAGADALCNYDDTVRMDNYLKKGKEAEKAGKTRDALLFYLAIDSFCGDGVEAKSSMRRIGLKLGARAAARGRLLSEEGLFKKVPDENCRRWSRYSGIEGNPFEPAVPGHCTTENGGMRMELNPQAGAFDWYETTFNYRDADLTMLKVIEQKPEDLDQYERVFRHFETRKRLNATGYRPDPAHMKELKKTAASNLDSTLAREEKEYGALKQPGRSMKTLETALRWASFLDENAKERVVVRAVSRADAAFQSDTPDGLLEALTFLSFADKNEQQSTVIIRAAELGQAALKKKDYELAEKYFLVAGNTEMAEAAKKLSEMNKTGSRPQGKP
jgi:tetratricopeptide (TPR) repeat protein